MLSLCSSFVILLRLAIQFKHIMLVLEIALFSWFVGQPASSVFSHVKSASTTSQQLASSTFLLKQITN